MKICVTLIPIHNSQEKVNHFVRIIKNNYEKGDKQLILASDAVTLEFADSLLWKVPEWGFIPHECATNFTKSHIVITTHKQNWNESSHLFNLTASPIKEFPFMPKTIYEFEDHSSPSKKEIFTEKYQIYRSLGYLIIQDPSLPLKVR